MVDHAANRVRPRARPGNRRAGARSLAARLRSRAMPENRGRRLGVRLRRAADARGRRPRRARSRACCAPREPDVPATEIFVFAPGSEDDGNRRAVYSRMFAPENGIHEDPATGSATGPLRGVHDPLRFAAARGWFAIAQRARREDGPPQFAVRVAAPWRGRAARRRRRIGRTDRRGYAERPVAAVGVTRFSRTTRRARRNSK